MQKLGPYDRNRDKSDQNKAWRHESAQQGKPPWITYQTEAVNFRLGISMNLASAGIMPGKPQLFLTEIPEARARLGKSFPSEPSKEDEGRQINSSRERRTNH
jgi:hypothetical protein